MESQFVMVAVAAVRLGVPAAWLKREAETGRVPSIRAGRSILVNPESVKAALLARAAGEHKAEGTVANGR